MVHNLRTKETIDVQATGTPSPGDRTATSACRSSMMGCGMGKKGLQGILQMAACCGAPLLLLFVLPVIGSALGGLGVSVLNTLAHLACPVGMAVMMWMMRRAQQASPQQAAQGQSTLPQVASTAPVTPQEGTIRADLTDARDTVVTLPSRPQAQVVTPLRSANGHQLARPTLAVNGHQAVAQPVGNRGTQAVVLPQE